MGDKVGAGTIAIIVGTLTVFLSLSGYLAFFGKDVKGGDTPQYGKLTQLGGGSRKRKLSHTKNKTKGQNKR
jgi:hypothetical protein